MFPGQIRKITILIFFIGVFCLRAYGSEKSTYFERQESEARQYLDKGNRFYEKGNFAEAKKEWDRGMALIRSLQGMGYIERSPAEIACMIEELERNPKLKSRVSAVKEKMLKKRLNKLPDGKKLAIKNTFRKAKQLYKQEKYVEAKELCSRIIAEATEITSKTRSDISAVIKEKIKYEQEILAIFTRAKILYEQKKYEEAKELCREIKRRLTL